MVLTAENVSRVFGECTSAGGQKVSGIAHDAVFDPGRIASCEGEIRDLLSGLPDQFRKSGGGGWSFLNACNDKDGNQWTGLHLVIEQLFLLGLAAGLVTELLPRECRGALPGGMPYYRVEL